MSEAKASRLRLRFPLFVRAAVLSRSRVQSSRITFQRAYHSWNLIHASAVTVLVLAAEFAPLAIVAAATLGFWSAFAFASLYLIAVRLHPGGSGPALPNILTSTRVVAAVSLLLLVAGDAAFAEVGAAARSATGWVIVAILGLVELTDFFDGRVARRMRAGAFGATWDMESDSLYALALTVFVRHVHGIGLFVLSIGLMRYLYVLFWQYDGVAERVPRIHKLFAKTTTALILVTLIFAVVPGVGVRAKTLALAVVLLLQTVSFVWDLLLQRGVLPLRGR